MTSFMRLEFLSETKKKEFELFSFGLLLATRGGYPHVSPSDVYFLVVGILERKVWNSTSPYTLKKGVLDSV